ncbi:aminopeptidase N [Cupriavidus necator]
MKMTNRSRVVVRADYQPSDYLIETVGLEFDLALERTVVRNTMSIRRRTSVAATAPLVLSGEQLELISVRVDGELITGATVSNSSLAIENLPERFTLTVETVCRPSENTSLTGLYASNGGLFTQCEAEGFRRITYFLDRPDVMATYRVTLRAQRDSFPVLLSNGNLACSADLADGRHMAVWDDPFPKPCYLFALVAADLVAREERIATISGKEKLLQIWVEPADLPKTAYAMDSLIKALRWDEERYGLELDLDRFMIVAVSDFNMGAMENKGLNIFNAKFILADPETTTDQDYANIESIVAHEYFHNWTGNRVTCRDWFQLSLKEGLTVFRDQEFSADMRGASSAQATKRIESVRMLRQMQFAEDASPMAHPVRPESYQEINNFYTPTVYNKGAEVVRMYQTLLGRSGFRRGMDLYFQRHDGQAVTCDDFRFAMADANDRDLKQFERWYQQAGTPRLEVASQYDSKAKRFTLTLTQHYAHCTRGDGVSPQPFHIPVVMGLLDSYGKDVPLRLEGEATPNGTNRLLELTEPTRQFAFVDVPAGAVPSLLRGFSAPVYLDYKYSREQLAFLFAHDSDPFSRWDAGQSLLLNELLRLTELGAKGEPLVGDPAVIAACDTVLSDASISPTLRELMLTLPSEAFVAEQMTAADPLAIHSARKALRQSLAASLAGQWRYYYDTCHSDAQRVTEDAELAGLRALRNLCLSYLAELGGPEDLHLAKLQYAAAANMTERMSALVALLTGWNFLADEELNDFYSRFEKDPRVIDKWFALQALRPTSPDGTPTVGWIQEMLKHRAFTLKSPNRVRALMHTFCEGNRAQFHIATGEGYQLWSDLVVQLDAINPQVAARFARVLEGWRKYSRPYQARIKPVLERVAGMGLSRNATEILEKALG